MQVSCIWCTTEFLSGFLPGTEVASMPKMFTKDVYVKPFFWPIVRLPFVQGHSALCFREVHMLKNSSLYVNGNKLATLLLVFYCNSNVREPVLTIIK